MKNIAIIGSGAGSIAILNSFRNTLENNFNISIFSEDHSQVGYAYKESPEFFIMNTRLDSLNQFDDVIPIRNWLSTINKSYSDDAYIPRSLYGKYLQDVKTLVLKELSMRGVSVQLYNAADFIDEDGNVICDESKHEVDIAIVSIGFGSDLLNDTLFNQIKNCDLDKPIKIYGSGLSSIDLILYAHSVQPNLPIECISHSGRFPRVRSQFKSGGASLFDGLKFGEFGFTDVINKFNSLLNGKEERKIIYDDSYSLLDEIDYCESIIPEWQKVIYSSTFQYYDAYQGFSYEDQCLTHIYRSRIIENRAMFPICNAKKLWTLLGDKQLKISKGCYSKNSDTKNDFLGFNKSKSNSFLTKSRFAQHKIMGVDVDANCKLKEKRNVYFLGPITNGSRFFTEATSITVRDSNIIVKDILDNRNVYK